MNHLNKNFKTIEKRINELKDISKEILYILCCAHHV